MKRTNPIDTRTTGNGILKSIALAGTLAVASLLPATAHARSDKQRVETTQPNRGMLRSGVVTLGLSYVPAFVVAASSDLHSDRYLYAPVAGPWLDFAKRECTSCEHETANKVLLVTDGIFQAIGALDIVGSVIFVETRTTYVEAEAPRFRLTPARMAGGYGLVAHGTF